MTSSQTRIFLIRHGETEWTLSGRHTGKTNIPLTENGQKQAYLLTGALKSIPFQKAFVSPLRRAKETFELSKLNVKAEFDEDLVEWDYGQYEGLTSKQIHQSQPGWSIFIQGAPGGESVADVGARANRVLSRLRSFNGNVLVFSSGHFLRVLAARWLDLPPSFGKYLVLSPASISILGFEHNTPAILQWNSTSYSESKN
jgi:broad specificity phosphatase PhoE